MAVAEMAALQLTFVPRGESLVFSRRNLSPYRELSVFPAHWRSCWHLNYPKTRWVWVGRRTFVEANKGWHLYRLTLYVQFVFPFWEILDLLPGFPPGEALPLSGRSPNDISILRSANLSRTNTPPRWIVVEDCRYQLGFMGGIFLPFPAKWSVPYLEEM